MLTSEAAFAISDHPVRAVQNAAHTLDLARVWPRLKAGQLRVADHFTSAYRLHIEVYEVAPRDGLRTRFPAVASNVYDVLESVLSGKPQKAIALELGLSCPSISQKVTRGLQLLGVRATASSIPAALVFLAELSQFPGTVRSEVVSYKKADTWHHSITLPRPEASAPHLTSAERQVMTLLVDGLSAKEIARRRETARRTVANQVAEIYRKLHTSRRISLIRRLYEYCEAQACAC